MELFQELFGTSYMFVRHCVDSFHWPISLFQLREPRSIHPFHCLFIFYLFYLIVFGPNLLRIRSSQHLLYVDCVCVDNYDEEKAFTELFPSV